MSHSVPPRPLSLLPFFAADGGLLFTALLIAWRTSGDLAGGALAGVVICVCLGAVLTVLPFVINDAREREAALAERQRELVDLVTSSTATSSRWGAQWAAAATGLEDAAGLAARNIAAAERLPAVFQDKVDAFARLFEQAAGETQAREMRAMHLEEACAARIEQAVSAAAGLERTLAGFGRMEEALRVRQAALEATLAECSTAATRAQTSQEALEARLVAAPLEVEAQVVRSKQDAELRLNAISDALATRLAGLETALGALVEQVERVKTLSSAPLLQAVGASSMSPDTMGGRLEAVSLNSDPLDTAELRSPAREETVLAVSVTPAEPAKPSTDPKGAIMDPFYIPTDGYSALAAAMDAGSV